MEALVCVTHSQLQMRCRPTDCRECPAVLPHTQESTDTPVELRSCVKVKVAVLGSPSLIVLTVSVDIKQY